MRTVDFTPMWTLRRVGCVADVSCETALLLDDNDVPHHSVVVKLNRHPVYEVLFPRREDAERDATTHRLDLLAAGWREDLAWLRSSVLPMTRAA